MITYTLPLRWKNGVRGSWLIRMVKTDFLNTLYDEYGVGYVLRKYPDLENTSGFFKIWLIRMVTQDSASLHCKWGIRNLACQGALAATWHFGSAPIGTVFPSTSWGIRPGSATGLGVQMQNFLPGTRGQRRFLGSHLPVQSFPFRFNPVSSLSIAFPKYSKPILIFSHSEFQSCHFLQKKGERNASVHICRSAYLCYVTTPKV